MECFRLLFDNLAWIEHQFLSGIRDSKKARSLWGMTGGVGGVRKSIHQSWLAKGLGLLCWGFKGVQQEIHREEASTLQIRSVAFPPGQCTSPQFHPCQTIWPRWASRQFLSLPKVLCSQWLLVRGCRYERIEEMKEAVTKVIDTLTQEDFHEAFQKLLERYNKCITAGGDYFEGGLEFHVCTINKSGRTKKSGNLFNDLRTLYIYIYIYI